MRVLLTVALIGLTACTSGESVAPDAGRTSSTPTTFPTLQDPGDPLLTTYCAAQDKVVALEGQLLSKHLPVAAMVQRMRQAQQLADEQIQTFHRYGAPALVSLARRWKASFGQVIGQLEKGARPVDALRPAIQALGDLERAFSCEIDG